MLDFFSLLSGSLAVGLAFAGPPLFILFIIDYEYRKEERKRKNDKK